MTWIRDFVRLTADQPPLWIAAIVAVGVICAVLVLVGGAVIATAGWTWLRSALDPDDVQRVRVDSPAARKAIENGDFAAFVDASDDAFDQVRR
jgi:hypothetical protein